MDIVSAPTTIDTPVTDLDIMVPSGLCRFTLRAEDSFKVSPTKIDVQWNGQTLVFTRSRIDYFTVQKRVIKTPVKKAEPKDVPSV